MPYDGDYPLRPLVSVWMGKIKLGMDHKKKKFQDDADECMDFFDGPYNWLYGLKHASNSRGFVFTGDADEFQATRPSFGMTVNKCAEMVQLFGPALYHKNPGRQVNPRKPPMMPIELFGNPQDPAVQMAYQQLALTVNQERAVDRARAVLIEFYQNWTPTATGLKEESRMSVDEALVKGMGLLWTECTELNGVAPKIAGSYHDTVDNLCIDPDMERRIHAKWYAKRCCKPHWEVEEMYGLERNSLRGRASTESIGRQAQVETDPNGDYNRRRGLTNDLVVYWEIYSKMGSGAKMSGSEQQAVTNQLDGLQDKLDFLGNYVYLVVAKDVPYPLNLGPELSAAIMADEPIGDPMSLMQEVQRRCEWPTPYWADSAGPTWPCSELAFHNIAREVWPVSHMKPGIGELKFLNWAYSMLAGKIRTACRDFLAVAKSASEELKENIRVGADYTFLEVDALHQDIDKVVKFLQHPTFQADIYKVIQAVEVNFEKRVGLTELMYGLTGKQMRSAQEVEEKSGQMSVRPDDMAERTEQWMTMVARNEALCARWHLQGQDVLPCMGPVGAQWWQQLVVPSDPAEILHQLEYRIEAGSTRKPNKQRDAANMQQAMQTLLPILMPYAQATGNVEIVNNLMADWAKSIDLDAARYLLKPPSPPPMMPGMPPPGGPGGPPTGQLPPPARGAGNGVAGSAARNAMRRAG